MNKVLPLSVEQTHSRDVSQCTFYRSSTRRSPETSYASRVPNPDRAPSGV